MSNCTVHSLQCKGTKVHVANGMAERLRVEMINRPLRCESRKRRSERMNKKEVLEIKKQFTPEKCVITRICGCYVDHEKNKKLESRNAFLSMPEEEAFKYYDIFRHTLSGTIGKNLLNLEVPLIQEAPGGTQEFLLRLRNSKLKDDQLIDEFYDSVIEHYEYGENYYIILIHGAYDIPGRSTDGLEMEDASDEVYEHLLCSICPVKMSKSGLSYNPERNSIEERIRDWIVDGPEKGFLFPAFSDRSSDIHSILYYSKKPEDLQPAFIEQVLGSAIPLSCVDQKETFHTIISETLGEECDYTIVKNIHENLNEMLEENKDNPEPLELGKQDVKKLLEQSGVPQEHMESFEEDYGQMVGEKNSLLAANIADTKKFSIETPDISIKVNSDRTDMVETRMIDNRQYLVIAMEGNVEVNGVSVNTGRKI